ncbi:TetR/AcrR family transcriptional regulator [Chakrabartyella piscis]|uniref:TetR/AcrR family transcriptional regulator n=1 Tax=Chakrabartyella piscis TaxID=2918914 RepID=UPI0029587C0B|nr:TetR/AcrR family transcriptional regulator [Chakrabartyella piscis]
MDRRQIKTRKAIMQAFYQLLNEKDFEKISVSEIANLADVGKSTFYLHFEAKELLIGQLCDDFFSHLMENHSLESHLVLSEILSHFLRHIYLQDTKYFLRLLKGNNDIFYTYLFDYLKEIFKNYIVYSDNASTPSFDFLVNHVVNSFIEAIKWSFKSNNQQYDEATVLDFLYCNKSLLSEHPIH